AAFLHHEVPGIDIPDKIMMRMNTAQGATDQLGVKIALEIIQLMKERIGGVYIMPAFSRYDLAAEIVESVIKMM
ncbi:MAG: bifunctional homocysteine S-methyltransferase/methylenetetrahydrofolate reductase, partial [Anaerolinea sp.]|nr:bifunctional homocysteine S-methyltransferase/methylenetetrahydrofolate reductase [Anaerolinea sp.]